MTKSLPYFLGRYVALQLNGPHESHIRARAPCLSLTFMCSYHTCLYYIHDSCRIPSSQLPSRSRTSYPAIRCRRSLNTLNIGSLFTRSTGCAETFIIPWPDPLGALHAADPCQSTIAESIYLLLSRLLLPCESMRQRRGTFNKLYTIGV